MGFHDGSPGDMDKTSNLLETKEERKQRIKKLKAKTSKMRLAIVTGPGPRRDITLGNKKYTIDEFEDHMVSKDRPTYSGEIPGSADKLRKERANPSKSAPVKHKLTKTDIKRQKEFSDFMRKQDIANNKVNKEFNRLNKRDGF